MKPFILPLLLALNVSAALAASSAADIPEPKPLDVILKHLDQSLKKTKSPKARSLKKAYDLLQSKQFAKVRASAQAVISDPAFSDYAHWLIASASMEQARLQADDEKLKDAAKSARDAFTHFSAVLNGSPYSPFHKQAARMLGEAQLLIGWGLSPSRESVRAFEDAFERLGVINANSSVLDPGEIEAFAESCKKFPNDLCGPWMTHLAEHHSPPGAPHATQAYHAPDLDFAAYDDAMAAVFSEKWGDAQEKFQKFTDEFPRSAFRYRARYWLARALREKGKKDEATKSFEQLQKDSPLSYYGMLSSVANSASPYGPMDQQIPQIYPAAVESDPAVSAPESYHLKRALIFLAEKSPELAAMELKEVHPRANLSSPFVMYLAALNYRAQNFPSLFAALTELFQREYEGLNSEIGLKMIFPVVEFDHIKKAALESKVDPVLVLSLIKQESAFDAHASSGSGASGLMQLMFATATETSPGVSRSDLLEPARNIAVGTRYLAKLLSKYQGNIVLALAAYNSGPAPVDRWVHEAVKQKYRMLEFIESIQYRETRDYVSSIIRNYFWYSKLLGTPLPKSLSYFWAPYSDLQHEIGGLDLPPPSTTPGESPSSSPSPSTSPSSGASSPVPSISVSPSPGEAH